MDFAHMILIGLATGCALVAAIWRPGPEPRLSLGWLALFFYFLALLIGSK